MYQEVLFGEGIEYIGRKTVSGTIDEHQLSDRTPAAHSAQSAVRLHR